MSHFLALLFAAILSFGRVSTVQSTAATEATSETNFIAGGMPLPVPYHQQAAHRVLYNSYAGAACASCLPINATSPEHWSWRAPR